MQRMPARNTLFYGDNLAILREHIPDGSVDLIYLDPPFNSNASYNVLFRAPGGHQSQAQIEAFDDTWHCNPLHWPWQDTFVFKKAKREAMEKQSELDLRL
jgi:DNA modification methylase